MRHDKKRETRELPAAKRTEGKKRKGRAGQTAVRQDCAGTGGKKPSCSESLITNETINVNNVHVAHCSNSTKLYIKCLLINARSIVKKVDDFKILLIEEGYDMVFVTESWTQAHIGDAEINVEGYDLFRKDRKTSRGGGCLIFTKKHLKITLIEDLTFNFESESVWCMCKTCDYELAIGVCYRNTSACDIEEENLHDCIKVACDRYKNIIIVGDFNHPTIKWDELHTQKEGLNFLNLTLDCFLTQHVSEPTRGRNILDLVLSKPEQLIEEVTITEPLGTSDHDTVEFKVPLTLCLPKTEISVFQRPTLACQRRRFPSL